MGCEACCACLETSWACPGRTSKLHSPCHHPWESFGRSSLSAQQEKGCTHQLGASHPLNLVAEFWYSCFSHQEQNLVGWLPAAGENGAPGCVSWPEARGPRRHRLISDCKMKSTGGAGSIGIRVNSANGVLFLLPRKKLQPPSLLPPPSSLLLRFPRQQKSTLVLVILNMETFSSSLAKLCVTLVSTKSCL